MEQFQQINEPEQSIFIEYFRVIRSRKWLILLCLILVVIPVGLWTYFSIPVYEAEATIIYEEPQDTMIALDIGQSFYNKSAIINMRIQLTSRTLAEDVAKSLPQEIVQQFNFPDPLPENFSKVKFIAGTIRENLTVSSERGADVLKIKIQANNPIAAKVITNTYIDHIIDWNLRKKREEISSVSNLLDKQLPILKNKLSRAEDALRIYKEKNNVVTLSGASSEALAGMTDAEVAYNQAKAEREALEQRMHFIEQKKRELAPSFTISSGQQSQNLKQQLANLEMQYSSLQLQGTFQNQSELTNLREKIDRLKQELIRELSKSSNIDDFINPLSQIRNILQESVTLEVDLETAKAREQGLKRIVDDYNAELLTLPKQELQLARLIREKEVNDNIYSMLLEKREEARITEAGKIGDVRVIDPAEKPIHPVKPNKKKNVAVGFVLGISLGVGLAFFLNSIDTSIKSQEDVDKYVGLPLLASIPKINQNGVFNISKNKHSKQFYSNKLLSNFEDIPHFYEAYRTLQLNFAFVNTDNKLKTVMLTSAGAGEGKTLTAVNMAQMFAKTGTNTVLLDCDLRRPMIHKILNLKQEPGLTNLLINKAADLSSGIQQKNNKNLSIITSGTLPPNPSEMLTSQSMNDLINKLTNQFDLIILDAPPVIAVNDSMILGKQVDGVCFVVRSEKAKREAVQRAKNILQGQDIKIFGIVLNDVNFKSQYGYYKDYYYYSDTKKKKRKV